MKAFIERVCIILQILCYSGAGLVTYNMINYPYATTEDVKLGAWKILILLIASIIVPTGIRWILTGKFQILPLVSEKNHN